MKQGKVKSGVWSRSISKQLHTKRDEVLLGVKPGEDCSALQVSEDEILVTAAQAVTMAVSDPGARGIIYAINNLVTSGAKPVAVLLDVLLPDRAVEQTLKEIMHGAETCASEMNVQIMGGHTEVTDAVNRPIVTVTGIGKVKKDGLLKTADAKPGMDLVLTKSIGLEGVSQLAVEREEQLLTYFPEHLVKEAQSFAEQICVRKEAEIAVEYKAAAMHDVSIGGIYGALWELADAAHVGLNIDLKAIPIRQETVEISEYLGINPYKLNGTGSLLIATEDGVGLVGAMARAGISAVIIGKTTNSNDRLLYVDDEVRYLETPQQDAFFEA